MSTVKVNTLSGTSTAGSIAVTGEGGSATTNLQQGLAKQWSRFNGTGTLAVADSFNTSSITDPGGGSYVIALINSMASENYCPLFTSAEYHEFIGNNGGSTGTLASGYKITVRNDSNATADTSRVASSVVGDLA